MVLPNLKHAVVALVITTASLLSVQNATAEDAKPVETIKPDNTKVNERDRDANEVTAGNQKENKNDIAITAKIRKMVVDDTSLSTNAHNIKIITVDGIVTLKGPVKSDAEKETIAKHAMHVVDEKSVKNEIDIAAQ